MDGTTYWKTDKSLSQCLGNMFDSQLYTDVTFLVGKNSVEVPAHKCILISRSPVFTAMFCGHLKEDKNVIVSDIEVEIFRDFLRYLYTDEICIHGDTAWPLIYVGRKYQTDTLVKTSEQFIIRHLSHDNAMASLYLAEIFNLSFLYKRCICYIGKFLPNISASQEFRNLDMKTKTDILLTLAPLMSSATLTPRFTQLLWSSESCGQCLEEQDIEVSDALRVLLKYSETQNGYLESSLLQNAMTAIEQKKSKHKEIYRCCRTGFGSCPQDGAVDAISFDASSDIYLQGITVYGSKFSPCVYDMNITVRKHKGKDILYHKQELDTSPDTAIHKVVFPSSIKIHRNERYSVILKMEGAPTYIGTCGNQRTEFSNVVITFFDNTDYNERTNIQGGQIPGLIVSLT